MDIRSTILTVIEGGFGNMDGVMAGVTAEQIHWTPPGKAQSIAATYGHALVSTDWQIHTLFQSQQGLWETDWAGKTGVTPPSPTITPTWGKTVQVDLEMAKQYDAAVRKATREFVQSVSDFEQIVDHSGFGFGEQTMTWSLVNLVGAHWNNLAGEISALKGVQGLRGYPF